jgi:hypothetical protein
MFLLSGQSFVGAKGHRRPLVRYSARAGRVAKASGRAHRRPNKQNRDIAYSA